MSIVIHTRIRRRIETISDPALLVEVVVEACNALADAGLQIPGVRRRAPGSSARLAAVKTQIQKTAPSLASFVDDWAADERDSVVAPMNANRVLQLQRV